MASRMTSATALMPMTSLLTCSSDRHDDRGETPSARQ
jgi:hypothetical protein